MPAGTPYALGRFRGSAGEDFCGVVIGPDVVPLAALHPAATGIESMLVAWPSEEKPLGAAVDDFVASRADQSGFSGQHRADAVRSAEELTPLAPSRATCCSPARPRATARTTAATCARVT
jgi:hypothetical protein